MKQKLKNAHYVIVVCENHTDDGTRALVEGFSDSKVTYIHTRKKGRGWAVKYAISQFPGYDQYIYLDVDLAGRVQTLGDIHERLSQGYEVVYANRYHSKSRSRRTLKRLVISKSYTRILNALFGGSIADYQCGFKGFSQEGAKLAKAMRDDHWFFDTELLLEAKRRHVRMIDVPIMWEERPDSTVRILSDFFAVSKSILSYWKRRLS